MDEGNTKGKTLIIINGQVDRKYSYKETRMHGLGQWEKEWFLLMASAMKSDEIAQLRLSLVAS